MSNHIWWCYVVCPHHNFIRIGRIYIFITGVSKRAINLIIFFLEKKKRNETKLTWFMFFLLLFCFVRLSVTIRYISCFDINNKVIQAFHIIFIVTSYSFVVTLTILNSKIFVFIHNLFLFVYFFFCLFHSRLRYFTGKFRSIEWSIR